MVNTTELKGFLAFMVKNNKQGVINALTSLGYNPPTTDADLVNFLIDIYSTKGTNGLNQVFSKVTIDKTKTTNEELLAIYELTSGTKIDPNTSKFSLSDFAALWSGSTVTTGQTSSVSSKPAVSPSVAAAVLIVVVVVVGVIIWKA